jgi:hypothetical protein
MRKFFTLLWLLCPVAAVYYHFNEGQNELLRMQARQARGAHPRDGAHEGAGLAGDPGGV